MNYQFAIEKISQHVVKFGVDIRPAISVIEGKTKLQEYCNRLIELFPQAFETLIVGPKQMQVQKTFLLSGGKQIELPTFLLTSRGPVFTFPIRMFINEVQNIALPEKDKIFRKAFEGLRNIFTEKKVPRLGVVNEFVFDTGDINSVEILSSSLKNELWRQRLRNLNIRLQVSNQDKNINIEIKPTQARRTDKAGRVAEDVRFGLIVNVDINNLQQKENLTTAQVNDIIAFADDYIPDELIKFLNNEY